MLQHISALTNIPWWLSQNGACPGVVVYKKPLQLAYPLPLKFDHKYNVTGPGRQGTFLCIERRYPQGRNSKKREPVQQNVDLPLVLPKQKKKPYPIPLKKIQQAAKADKKLAEFGIEKKLEPPKNGLLVPSLVPAAYELLDDWKLLIKGLAQLLHYVPVHALNAHKSMLLKVVMRFRIALAQPTVVAEASTPG